LTWIQHYYGNVAGKLNLLGSKNSIISKILYHKFSKMTKKSFISIYLFKTWGPPYGKIKKTFKDSGSSRTKSVAH
jgi:sulfide:quinone oxidoreductase